MRSKFEKAFVATLEGVLGRIMFPLGIFLLGTISACILFWFVRFGIHTSGQATLVLVAFIANLFAVVGGAMGMQHYRTLGFLDAITRRDGQCSPSEK